MRNAEPTWDGPAGAEQLAPPPRSLGFGASLYFRLYRWRRPVVFALYGALAVAAYYVGFLLRFDFGGAGIWWPSFAATAAAVAATRMLLAWAFQLSSGRWRFISTIDVLRLLGATTTGTLLLLGFRELLLGTVIIPRSVLLIEWVVTTQLTAAVWLFYRTSFERLRHARWDDVNPGDRKRVVIIGAGEAGNLLAREIQRYPTGYHLVGFVDDDELKRGCRIRGVEVIGGMAALPAIAASHGVEELIIAVPSASPAELRQLVEQCEGVSLPFKVLPGIGEVLRGEVRLSQLRELRLEDLLGRKPIRLELPELAREFEGQCVLITGAAGSIGSELARQVALHRPSRLVVLDQAETDLFYLERELREAHPELDLVAVITDIVDAREVRRVFQEHAPARVFHAAAYKHVPLMESNPEQAVRNNVIGTRIVAEEAGRSKCGKFVLVSTDKAVRPSSVMGATKRLAELVVLALQRSYPDTAFGAVRFGNVLGSNGSVIPIFQRQIENVQPLTVTHPDATRYFMMIPEAVQLILQASVLDELQGHIAMLNMGEPIRIADLAMNMLRLAGIPPREGETIVYTGLRPGEKMHEELAAPNEQTLPTRVPKVHIVRTGYDAVPAILNVVDRWSEGFAAGRGAETVGELRGMFIGLAPGAYTGNGRAALAGLASGTDA